MGTDGQRLRFGSGRLFASRVDVPGPVDDELSRPSGSYKEKDI
jgi:hypothetical protein